MLSLYIHTKAKEREHSDFFFFSGAPMEDNSALRQLPSIHSSTTARPGVAFCNAGDDGQGTTSHAGVESTCGPHVIDAGESNDKVYDEIVRRLKKALRYPTLGVVNERDDDETRSSEDDPLTSFLQYCQYSSPPAVCAYPGFGYFHQHDIASSSSQGRPSPQLYPAPAYLYSASSQSPLASSHHPPSPQGNLSSHFYPPATYQYPQTSTDCSAHMELRQQGFSSSHPNNHLITRDLARQPLLYSAPANLAMAMSKSSCCFCSGHPSQAELPCNQCLQGFLDTRDAEITENTLAVVLQSVHNIMMNNNGRRLFEKLLDVTDRRQQQQIFNCVTSDSRKLLKVAKDTFGSQCLMKLIKIIKLPIGRFLRGKMSELMTSKHGVTVIQFCFEHLTYADNEVLIQAALESWNDLATNQCGCLAITCCMKNSEEPHRNLFLRKTAPFSIELSFHSSGNYVVNCAIGLEVAWAVEEICCRLARDVVMLSMHKNGSYVIEQGLKSSGSHHIIQALALLADHDLEDMIQDDYANYVLKTALQFPERGCDLYQKMFRHLERVIVPYQNHPHATKLYKVTKDIKRRFLN